jgi:hypothetical protein
MTMKSLSSTASQRTAKARRFYIVTFSYSGERRANWEVDNLDVLSPDNGVLLPPKGRRGFPDYPEKPHLMIGKRKVGHPPRDMEEFHSYWLISHPLKVLFESIDPQAFAFQSRDVKLRDGSTGPVYWLCDVIRVLDAFGDVTLQEIRRHHGIFNPYKAAVFKEDIVRDSHIFRTPYSVAYVFCDQDLKDACRRERIKGIGFEDCINGQFTWGIAPKRGL